MLWCCRLIFWFYLSSIVSFYISHNSTWCHKFREYPSFFFTNTNSYQFLVLFYSYLFIYSFICNYKVILLLLIRFIMLCFSIASHLEFKNYLEKSEWLLEKSIDNFLHSDYPSNNRRCVCMKSRGNTLVFFCFLNLQWKYGANTSITGWPMKDWLIKTAFTAAIELTLLQWPLCGCSVTMSQVLNLHTKLFIVFELNKSDGR